MGESEHEITNRVLEGKEWGGFIEIATALWHTDAECMIMHADNIHQKASALAFKGNVHDTRLNGLRAGPQAKKRKKVFVILEKNHYYFGHVDTGSVRQAIFKDDPEAEALLVDFLMQRNKGPLAELNGQNLRGGSGGWSETQD